MGRDRTPGTDFQIEFFSSSACDASGHGEGESFIGQITEATDGNGNLAFMSTFPVAVPVGRFITATATDPAGNTSSIATHIEEVTPDQVMERMMSMGEG